MSAVLRPGRGGTLLTIRVSPRSSRDQVSGLYEDAGGAMSLAIKVTAPPDKGKANKAVIALLAEWAGLPKSHLTMVAGEADRLKTVLVTGNIKHLKQRIALMNIGRTDGEAH